MGYYRGVRHRESRSVRLARRAERMRDEYLYAGKGCATRRKLVERRTWNPRDGDAR